jgi:hypothetical protein
MTEHTVNRIKCFVVNIKERINRREHILKEFAGRDEFDVTLVPAIVHENGAAGLLETIQNIIREMIDRDDEFIILCEDDHQFTTDYSPALLHQAVAMAKEKKADMLCGGVSWFRNAIEVTDHLFWVERFTGLQFTVIFKKFYSAILNISTEEIEAVDLTMGMLTERKFFIYPFISTQKEFGYSDINSKNGEEGHVTRLFDQAQRQCEVLTAVKKFYPPFSFSKDRFTTPLAGITIPVYVINETPLPDREWHIWQQLEHRTEFERAGAGLWPGILQFVQHAMENDDDVIIICKDTLEFTGLYNREYLISHIMRAHELRCEILLGDMHSLYHTVPVAQHLFWIDAFSEAQLMVIFRNCFEKILNEIPEPGKKVCEILSDVTTHKMVLYPFITKKRAAAVSTDEMKAEQVLHNTEAKLNIMKEVFLNLSNASC